MRTFLVIAAVALFAVSASALRPSPAWHSLDGYTFEEYVVHYNKNYPADEYEMRKALFDANMAEIQRHNREDHSWKMGVNHMTDHTDSEYRALLGRVKHANLLLDTPEEFSASPNFKAPAFVDWRLKGVVSAVKDQGRCGSCWTFAASAVLESAWAIATGELPVLSEQQILDCTPNPNHCGGTGGCAGGTAELAYAQIAKMGGLSSEWTYPYVSYQGKNFNCSASDKTPPAAKVASYMNVKKNDYASHVEALTTKGPLAISVDASQFRNYETGVFSGCDMTANVDLNHAVVLVGMGNDPVHGDYFLVRNSWSPVFGEAGYIRMKRNASPQCGTDSTPLDGFGCTGGPSQITACGMCGMLSDTAFPIVNTA